MAASIVGLLSASVSVYWGLGGTWLLDTLGGTLERNARAGHAFAVVVPLGTAALKLVAVVLPLLAVGLLMDRARHRWARVLTWVQAAVLTIYGLVYTGVGLLLQADVLHMTAADNHRALAWHAYLWDPLFLIWGLLVVMALLRSRPTLLADATSGRREGDVRRR